METNSYYTACRINTSSSKIPVALRSAYSASFDPSKPQGSQPFSITLLWFVLGADNFLGSLRVLLFLLNKVGLIEQGSE